MVKLKSLLGIIIIISILMIWLLTIYIYGFMGALAGFFGIIYGSIITIFAYFLLKKRN